MSEQGSSSRRQFLRGAAGAFAVAVAIAAGGGAVFGASRRGQKTEWYEIVQDVKDGGKWHINWYAGRKLGDLENGSLVEHRTAAAEEVEAIRKRHGPARVQFSTGHQERIGMA